MKIPLVCVWSANFRHLFEIFKKSLLINEDIELITKEIDLSSYTKFGFRTDSWYEAAILKVSFILENLKERDKIIFSDCDIQYFNPFILNVLFQELETKDLEYYGTKEPGAERKIYNCGFYVIRKTEKTITLFKKTIEAINRKKFKFAEQDVINVLLKNMKIKHAFIEEKYYCMGPEEKINEFTAFHHAIVSQTSTEKINQFKDKYLDFFKITNKKLKYAGLLWEPKYL